MNPKALKNKKSAQRFHTKKRAAQRYGLTLTTEKQQEIVRKIQNGDGWFLRAESKRITHWAIQYAGQTLPVVYDKARKELVTVLPPKALLGER